MVPSAGAAEPGGSFASTAIGELKEEAGVTVTEDDLIPFATLSEAGLHTIIYPNGDETHCFAVCFFAERWRGDPQPDGEETTEIEFADPASPPSPIHGPTAHALELLKPTSARVSSSFGSYLPGRQVGLCARKR